MGSVMHLQGFNVRHLAVLDMLFTERHVGRTADQLGLTQPAVSNTLAWLRTHFGDPLLVRSGGSMRLTPFAERLREPVRRLLLDFRSVTTNRPVFDPAIADNRFRIVMSHYVSSLCLTELLALLSREAPRARIEIARIDGDVNEFRRGEVDLVIVPRERLFPFDTVDLLFSDRWVCVGSAAAWPKKTKIDLEGYLSVRHVLPDQPQTLTPVLQALHIERDIAAVVPYALLLFTLIGTPWLATVPKKFVELSPWRDRLRTFPPPFTMHPTTIAQQWHPETTEDAAILWLRRSVREALTRAGIDLLPSSHANDSDQI